MEGGQQGWGSRLWDLWKLLDEDTQSPWLLLLSLLLAGPVLPKHIAHWRHTAFTFLGRWERTLGP